MRLDEILSLRKISTKEKENNSLHSIGNYSRIIEELGRLHNIYSLTKVAFVGIRWDRL